MGKMNCYHLHFIHESYRKMSLVSGKKSKKESEIELEYLCPKTINHLFIINQQITIPKTHFLKNTTFSITDLKKKNYNPVFRFLSHNMFFKNQT